MKRRILSIITALALCLSLCPAWAFAAEADPALCKHHPAHTGECGYAAPTGGQPCGHEHTAACYALGVLPGADGGGDYEIGADTENPLDCRHAHDAACGYVQAEPGQPCGFVCPLCPIETLIAALPGEVTPENLDDVRAQLDEILALFSELTEDEQEQIDLSRVYALQEALDGANDPDPVESEVSVDYQEATWNGSAVTYTPHTGQSCNPVTDTTTEWNAEWYAVSGTVTIDQPITVIGDVNLILTDGCTLNAEQGIVVTTNNSLTIYAQSENGGTLNATGAVAGENGSAAAGIGGSTTEFDSGSITIHGGVINATGGGKAGYYGGAGIGGSTSASENGGNSGAITIYGGTITANSGTGNVTGAGIGGGSSNSDTDGAVAGDGSGIIIYGGDVTATSHATAAGGAGIGGGGAAKNGSAGSNIQIFGGRVTATGGKCAAGIGGGSGNEAGSGGAPTKSGDGAVTISGGIVTAVGSGYAAGIGGGGGYEYTLPLGSPPTTYTLTGGTGNVTISGGIVDASSPTDVRYADYKGAPIGNGGNAAATATVSKTNAIVFENGVGTVCGNVTLTEPYTVPDGYSLRFEDGAAVTGEISVPSAAARVEKGGRITGFLDESGLDAAFEDSGNSGATITLLADVERTEPLRIQIDCVLDLGGHTICCEQECLTVHCDNTGAPLNVTIRGEGKVISTNNTALTVWGNVTLKGGTFTSNGGDFGGVYVNNPKAKLSVTGESVIIQNTGGGYGLAVNNAQSVQLSAGKYSGTAGAISIVSGSLTLGNLLAHSGDTRYAYFKDTSTTPIPDVLGDKSLTGTVTVGECMHDKSVCAYTPNEDADTHAMTCRACGLEGAVEDCQYTYTPDSGGEHHTTACQFCGRAKTETHTYGLWTPEYNGRTVTIRRSCESCGYTKTDGTITAPSEIQTMEYGTPITLTCSSTLPDATFRWSLMDADIGADRTPVQESTGTSFTPSETLAVGKYFWEAIVKWAGSDNNIWSSSDWLQVTPAPLPDATLSPASAVYNGTAQKPAVAIAGLTAGTDYTVAYTGDFTNAGTHTVTVTGQGNYEGTVTKTFTIEKATLNVEGSGIAAGTYGAKLSGLAVSGLTAKLNGTEVPGTWKLAGAAIPNAGDTETHAAAFTPAGGGENYKPLTAQVTLNIAKAAALPTKPGDLAVANGRAHTYTYGLGALRPDVPEGMSLGSAAVTYELGTVSLGSYYDSAKDGAKIEGQTLTLPIEAVDTEDVQEIGTVTVIIHTQNFEDMTATIKVRSVNKIIPTGGPVLSSTTLTYGQALKDITLSGSMQDNGTPVPGKFEWSNPDNRPAVQESYAAAWTFTPEDNNAYAIVTGIAIVTVNKAVPSLTLTPSPAVLPNGGAVTLTLTGLPSGGSAAVTCSDETIPVTKGSGDTWTADLPAGGASYTFTASYAGDANHSSATATCTVSVEKITPTLTLAAVPGSLTGGGVVTLTLSGLPSGGTAAVACSDSGITVTAGDGGVWTAILPNRTASYTFTASYEGDGSHHGASAACTVTTKEVIILPGPPAGEHGEQFQLVMETGIDQVPAGLQDLETLNTPEKLTAAMRSEITQATPGIPQASTAVYDVTLLVSTDGGSTWVPAAKENFPEDGLTVTLPYPEGTDSSFRFTVVHMFTTADFGKQPGDTEVFTPDQVKNTADGIQVTVSGLSPISVGWTEAAPDTPPTGAYGGGWIVSAYAVTVEKAAHGKVTASRANAASGSVVTLTASPDSGYVLDTLSVTDSRGNEVKLTAQENGKYTFTMPGRAVTVKAAFAPLPEETAACDGGADCPSYGFADLGGVGTWYHEAVDYVLSKGLMGGYGSGLFQPDSSLSRAQFAQILYNLEGRPAVTAASPFTDAAPGAWYAPAVTWAAARGVVDGYGNGLFGPDGSITREQLAVMLWRYAGTPAATEKELHFNDAGMASGYALDALRWAVEHGILSGKGGGILDPKGLATRAQAAQMLRTFLKDE